MNNAKTAFAKTNTSVSPKNALTNRGINRFFRKMKDSASLKILTSVFVASSFFSCSGSQIPKEENTQNKEQAYEITVEIKFYTAVKNDAPPAQVRNLVGYKQIVPKLKISTPNVGSYAWQVNRQIFLEGRSPGKEHIIDTHELGNIHLHLLYPGDNKMQGHLPGVHFHF